MKPEGDDDDPRLDPKVWPTNFTCGVILYALNFAAWLGGGFPIREDWSEKIGRNLEIFADNPSEIIVLFAAAAGGSLFAIGGILCFAIELRGKAKNRIAKIGIGVGLAFVIPTFVGTAGS